MILSNTDIQNLIATGELVIDPLSPQLTRSASVCLRLGSELMLLECEKEVDLRREDTYPRTVLADVDESNGFALPPKTLILANTIEKISLPKSISGWLSNLSGLARIGLQVVSSSLVSPGYGERSPTTLTLELLNTLDVALRVFPGMRICHLSLFQLRTAATIGYDGQVGTYSGQTSPRGSRYFTDFRVDGASGDK